MIYPYLSYGILSWGSTYKTKLKKVLQNKVNILEVFSLLHPEKVLTPYHKLLDILKLENVYTLKTSSFIHKIYNKSSVPSAFQYFLTPVTDVHHHNSRYASKQFFYRTKIRTNYGMQTFRFSATKIWGNIPNDLKTLSANNFKVQYKKYLLIQQN